MSLRFFLVGVSARFSTAGLALFLTFVQSKTISMSEIGLYNVGYVMALALSTMGRFSFRIEVLRGCSILIDVGAKEESFKKYILSSFVVFLSSLIVVFLFFIFYNFFLRIVYDFGFSVREVFYFLFSVPFVSLLMLQGSFLRAIGRPNTAGFVESPAVMLGVLTCGLFSLILGFDISLSVYAKTYMYSCVVVCLLSFFLMFFYLYSRQDVGKKNSDYKINAFNMNVKDRLDLFAVELLSFGSFYGVYFIAGVVLAADDMGVFVILYRISMVFSLVMTAINGITIAEYAKLFEKRSLDKLSILCGRSSGYGLLLSAPAFTLVLLFSEDLLALFSIHTKEAHMIWSLIMLSAVQYLSLLSGPGSSLMNITGKQRILRNLSLFSMLLSFLFVAILGDRFGLLGASLGCVMAQLVRIISVVLIVKPVYGFYIYPRL